MDGLFIWALILIFAAGMLIHECIEAHWKGKKEVEHEKRLAAEANAKAAQAKIEAIRLQDHSRHNG